jgi:hypothetical protein
MDEVQQLKRDARLSKTLLNSCVFLLRGKAYDEILLEAKFFRDMKDIDYFQGILHQRDN